MQAMVVHLLNVTVIWAILALSLNFLQGTAGLWSLGHAGFFAIGAYASALLAKTGLPWFACLLGAIAFPVLVAFVYGLPTLRLRADYFSSVSLGLGEIIRHVLNNWQSLTGGPNGVISIPKPSLFGFEFDRRLGTIAIGLVVLGFTYLALDRWRRSGFGRVLKAQREDGEATQALGKNTYWFKLWCFLISAAFAGIAGSLFAHYYGFIYPGDFGLWVTFNLILTIMIGGNGSYRGTMAAALVFVLLREGLRFLPLPATSRGPLQQFIYGALLIVIAVRIPRGLIPETPTIGAPRPTGQAWTGAEVD